MLKTVYLRKQCVQLRDTGMRPGFQLASGFFGSVEAMQVEISHGLDEFGKSVGGIQFERLPCRLDRAFILGRLELHVGEANVSRNTIRIGRYGFLKRLTSFVRFR